MLRTPLAMLWRRSAFGFCQSINDKRRAKQDLLTQLIQKSMSVTYISVKDTTVDFGSCGHMYKFVVESPQFDGKTKVQQHKMVMKALASEIKNIHGFNLKTRTPKNIEPPKQAQPSPTSTDKPKES